VEGGGGRGEGGAAEGGREGQRGEGGFTMTGSGCSGGATVNPQQTSGSRVLHISNKHECLSKF
jgi:hypothetical protein